jgi:hypothetical protein
MVSMGAKADTLTFNSSTTGTSVGPYNMTLTVGATNTALQLFCVNDNLEISAGEYLGRQRGEWSQPWQLLQRRDAD